MIINRMGSQIGTTGGTGKKVPAGDKSQVADTVQIGGNERETLDIYLDNQGRSNFENDYKITKKTPQGNIEMFLDNRGKSDQENDFHVTGKTPEGKVDFNIDNTGTSHAENNFKIKGKDLKGEFDLFVDNRGNSQYENDYNITGDVYGEKVDISVNNTGKSKYENDFSLKGEVPSDFLTSPLFSGIVLPAIATIPVLNEAGKITERVKGPLLFNMGMQFLGAIEREMKE